MRLTTASLLSFLLLLNSFCFSQEESKKPSRKKSKIQSGLFLGSYFANKHTAALYDGYGFDMNGVKNDFINSFMFRRIVMDYGGGLGQQDLVADALKVTHGDWTFDETDMPMNMRYIPAFMVGAQMVFAASKKDALLISLDAAKLILSGNFTIVITTPPIGPQPPGYENIKTFAITGGEQRMIIRGGYRRILGDDDVFNFFIEGGPSLCLANFLRNQVTINNLQIDLGTYYSNPFYTTYNAKFTRSIGLGGFAGLGLDIHANQNWTIQFVYSPSYEKINLGEVPKHTLQHAVGLRAFYNL